MSWSGGLLDWTIDSTAYISVVFSWQLQKAYQRAVWHKTQGLTVKIGGPATSINPSMFDGIATVETYSDDAIGKHNPDAMFTSRGCVRFCTFCIVPKHEGDLVELDTWPIRPIVCDNNILATSKKHFDKVVDSLKPLKDIDFNQGLDARLLTKAHADRLRELKLKVVRLAWDHIGIESQFMTAWKTLMAAGFPPSKIQSYVLIGFNDTPEDALYRLQKIKDLDGLPNPMRFQPLDAQKRNMFIHPNWTEYELKAYMRYWSRQRWLRPVPFEEYLEGYKKNAHPENEIFKSMNKYFPGVNK